MKHSVIYCLVVIAAITSTFAPAALAYYAEPCTKPNEHYDSCGSPCVATCQNRQFANCAAYCVEGCYCNDGYIRDEESKECVLIRHCPKY